MLVLSIVVDSTDEDLIQWYDFKIMDHNTKINNPFPDSGFDLACPINETITQELYTLDLKVKCAMFRDGVPCGFMMYPRSSMAKTPLRLANHVGIIDSGYRGSIMAMLDVKTPTQVTKLNRYLQLCAPTLEPFSVERVLSLDNTERGSGGFGSTGH
jgi:dUTP pyrophosphatase